MGSCETRAISLPRMPCNSRSGMPVIRAPASQAEPLVTAPLGGSSPSSDRPVTEAVTAWRAADPPVTGVCAFNDDVALALLAALPGLGLRAPQDLAVIGVDDVLSAQLANPPLTTVVRDLEELARGLARRVVDTLSGEDVPAEPIQEDVSVVLRESA